MDVIGAVILAGGRSRRFGRDKANVAIAHRTLVQHVLDALPRSHGETVLVLRPDQPRPAATVDRVVFDDPGLHEGPLRGIITGLEAISTKWAWVIACDLPGLQGALLCELARARTAGALAIIPAWGGRLQPLCALYSSDAVPLLRGAALAGATSVRTALEQHGFIRFAESRCRALDPAGRSFININTREALERFRSGT